MKDNQEEKVMINDFKIIGIKLKVKTETNFYARESKVNFVNQTAMTQRWRVRNTYHSRILYFDKWANFCDTKNECLLVLPCIPGIKRGQGGREKKGQGIGKRRKGHAPHAFSPSPPPPTSFAPARQTIWYLRTWWASSFNRFACPYLLDKQMQQYTRNVDPNKLVWNVKSVSH